MPTITIVANTGFRIDTRVIHAGLLSSGAGVSRRLASCRTSVPTPAPGLSTVP
jgi:hypothetical protein